MRELRPREVCRRISDNADLKLAKQSSDRRYVAPETRFPPPPSSHPLRFNDFPVRTLRLSSFLCSKNDNRGIITPACLAAGTGGGWREHAMERRRRRREEEKRKMKITAQLRAEESTERSWQDGQKQPLRLEV